MTLRWKDKSNHSDKVWSITLDSSPVSQNSTTFFFPLFSYSGGGGVVITIIVELLSHRMMNDSYDHKSMDAVASSLLLIINNWSFHQRLVFRRRKIKSHLVRDIHPGILAQVPSLYRAVTQRFTNADHLLRAPCCVLANYFSVGELR